MPKTNERIIHARKRRGAMAAKNSCIYIQYTYFWLVQKFYCVIYVRKSLSLNISMERRLMANEALERVLDDQNYAYS